MLKFKNRKNYTVGLFFLNLIFICGPLMLVIFHYKEYYIKNGFNLKYSVGFFIFSLIFSYILIFVNEIFNLLTYKHKMKQIISNVKNKTKLHLNRIIMTLFLLLYLIVMIIMKICLFNLLNFDLLGSTYIVPTLIFFIIIEPINYWRIKNDYDLSNLESIIENEIK